MRPMYLTAPARATSSARSSVWLTAPVNRRCRRRTRCAGRRRRGRRSRRRVGGGGGGARGPDVDGWVGDDDPRGAGIARVAGLTRRGGRGGQCRSVGRSRRDGYAKRGTGLGTHGRRGQYPGQLLVRGSSVRPCSASSSDVPTRSALSRTPREVVDDPLAVRTGRSQRRFSVYVIVSPASTKPPESGLAAAVTRNGPGSPRTTRRPDIPAVRQRLWQLPRVTSPHG